MVTSFCSCRAFSWDTYLWVTLGDFFGKFSRNCPKFHILTKIKLLKVQLRRDRLTAFTLYILWKRLIQNLLFHFGSCEPLKHAYRKIAIIICFVVVGLNLQNDTKFETTNCFLFGKYDVWWQVLPYRNSMGSLLEVWGLIWKVTLHCRFAIDFI